MPGSIAVFSAELPRLMPSDDYSSSHSWNGNSHASVIHCCALHTMNKSKEAFNRLAVNFLQNLSPVSISNSINVTFEL